MYTLGSLFDGIGGWLLAATKYGIEPLWASEIEPFPIAVTKRHFPGVTHLGDITRLDGAVVHPVDIVCLGSPCQDLSVAGKREGLSGERSGLFHTAIKFIRRMRTSTGGRQPRFAVWENVPGAFSSNKGLDFCAVLSEIGEAEVPMPAGGKWANAGLAELPDRQIAWRVLDAQFWGVPQRRNRIFLVCDFGGRCAAEILFEQEGVPGDNPQGDTTAQMPATRFSCGVGGAGKVVQIYEMAHAAEAIRSSAPGVAPTLQARMGTGGNQVPLVDTYCIAGNMVDRETHQHGSGISKGVAPTLNTVDRHAVYAMGGEVCNTVTNKWHKGYGGPSGNECGNMVIEPATYQKVVGSLCSQDAKMLSNQYVAQDKCITDSRKRVRRLTPTECERLQGLPDGYTAGGSDSARYKALGNGMAQPCADYVIGKIAKILREGKT